MRRSASIAPVMAGLLAGATAASAQVEQTVNFAKDWSPVALSYEGVQVVVHPRQADYGSMEMMATVRAPGLKPLSLNDGVTSATDIGRWIGIGTLSPSDRLPSVLLAGYSGGAHCCAALTAIVPGSGGLKVIRFPQINVGPVSRFPTDVDGDGTVDFVLQDDSFRYAFATGAGSWSPPMFFNISKGQLIDVSRRRSFRKQWELFAGRSRAACHDLRDDDRNGGCAAYVAAAARLGGYGAALHDAEKFANPHSAFPAGCSIPTNEGDCPPGKRVEFNSFGPAIRSFLKAHGYVP